VPEISLAAAPFTAGDIMDESASLLNDSVKALFTYTAQIPYLKRANESLENLLVSCGISIQRRASIMMTVTPQAGPIDLGDLVGYPSEMLLPISLFERGSSQETWNFVPEKEWIPDIPPTGTVSYWAFHDNTVFITGVTSQREVKINFWRQLSTITSEGSNAEVAGSKTFLAAKTAEMCARYIGQNPEVADSLYQIEVVPAQDLLERIYIKNTQGVRSRRLPFRRPRR
jgi:hypothetical protein